MSAPRTALTSGFDSGVIAGEPGMFGAVEAGPVGAWSEVVGPGSSVSGSMMPPSFWSPAGGFWQGVRVPITLSKGTLIGRFGGEGGTYASPLGVEFPARALPPETLVKYPTPSVYEVVEPFQVDAGFAEPWFGYPGMGVQYQLPWPVKQGIPTYLKRR